MQIQSSGIIDSSFINIICNLFVDIKIINWSGDVREPIPDWFKDVGKHENVITCFTNMSDVNKLRDANCKSEYLQIGYEHNIFTRNGSIKDNAPEIVFFGNNYSKDRFELSEFRLDAVVALKEKYGHRFQAYGFGYPNHINALHLMYKAPREAEVYRSCKIAIGISHFQLSRYSSDRMFRAMGSGAFYMPHWYPDIDMDFENKYHLVWWKSLQQLLSLIDYYLENDGDRKRISMQGNKLVESKHRWINRMSDLKSMLELK
jgi:spore maturation protein CgeB